MLEVSLVLEVVLATFKYFRMQLVINKVFFISFFCMFYLCCNFSH